MKRRNVSVILVGRCDIMIQWSLSLPYSLFLLILFSPPTHMSWSNSEAIKYFSEMLALSPTTYTTLPMLLLSNANMHRHHTHSISLHANCVNSSFQIFSTHFFSHIIFCININNFFSTYVKYHFFLLTST